MAARLSPAWRNATNYRRIAWASLGPWLATVIVVAVLFVRGRTAPSTDGRRAILLNPAGRDLVLGEMRAMLGSVQGVVQGVRTNDLGKAASAARASGMAAVDLDPGHMARLPLEFKRLGMRVHRGFDDLAAAVDNGATGNDALARLAVQLVSCVACHASFRIDAGSGRWRAAESAGRPDGAWRRANGSAVDFRGWVGGRRADRLTPARGGGAAAPLAVPAAMAGRDRVFGG